MSASSSAEQRVHVFDSFDAGPASTGRVVTPLLASRRASGTSEGMEEAVGRLEWGENYFSKDMALAMAVHG